MSLQKPLLLLAIAVLSTQVLAATPAVVEITGPTGTRKLSADQVAGMPRSKVTISDHGVEGTFEGPTIASLLATVGAPAGEKIRGDLLTNYVLVEAVDAYRALFTLTELDAAFTDRLVILADTRDGKPLPEKEGPFRVIVQGEKRQARCVRQVARISNGKIK